MKKAQEELTIVNFKSESRETQESGFGAPLNDEAKGKFVDMTAQISFKNGQKRSYKEYSQADDNGSEETQ